MKKRVVFIEDSRFRSTRIRLHDSTVIDCCPKWQSYDPWWVTVESVDSHSYTAILRSTICNSMDSITGDWFVVFPFWCNRLPGLYSSCLPSEPRSLLSKRTSQQYSTWYAMRIACRAMINSKQHLVASFSKKCSAYSNNNSSKNVNAPHALSGCVFWGEYEVRDEWY